MQKFTVISYLNLEMRPAFKPGKQVESSLSALQQASCCGFPSSFSPISSESHRSSHPNSPFPSHCISLVSNPIRHSLGSHRPHLRKEVGYEDQQLYLLPRNFSKSNTPVSSTTLQQTTFCVLSSGSAPIPRGPSKSRQNTYSPPFCGHSVHLSLLTQAQLSWEPLLTHL